MNGPAYRAVARVARRQATRAPWRSLLIVAMVALPIAALTTTAIAIRTSVPTDAERIREQFGSADLSVYTDRHTTGEELAAALPARTRIASVGFLDVSRPLMDRASIVYYGILEYGIPIDRPPARGIYRMLEGVAPTRPGEAAVGPRIMESLGLHIGDVHAPRRNVDLRITGTVVSAGHRDDSVVVVGPGTFAALGRGHVDTWLVQLPLGVPTSTAIEGISAMGLTYTDPAATLADHALDRRKGTGGAFAAACVLLLGTGLIAGAAFAVGARRQLRTLGLLGAAGAERRHVRATVLLTGATLGTVGSAVGVALGIAVVYPIHPYLDRLAGRYVGSIEYPWAVLVLAFALGTAAAIAAAVLPARTAARIAVVQALAERTPPPRRPGRLALAGVVVVGLGAAVAANGAATSNDPVLAAGLVAMIVGILVGIPLLVVWTGRLAGVLPTLARIAARDIARNGRRTGAALAAGAIALGVPVSIGTVTLGDRARYDASSSIAVDQLSLWGFGSGKVVAGEIAAALDGLRVAFPGSVGSPIVPAVAVVTRDGRTRDVPASVIQRDATGYLASPLYVGDADVLRAVDAEGGIPALERGAVIGVGLGPQWHGVVDVGIDRGAEPRVLARKVSVAPAGDDSSLYAGDFFVSAVGARQLGLRASPDPVLEAIFRAPGALSTNEIARAKDLVSRRYPDVAVQSQVDVTAGSDLLRDVATVAGVAVALMIVGVIVALLSAESRRDRAILVAVGGGPRSRRAVAGATAALIAALSAGFAVVVGLVPTSVLMQLENQDQPLVVPWAVIAIVVLATPAIAGLAAGLLSREPKAAQLLRPIS